MITLRISCTAFVLFAGSCLGASVSPLQNPGFDVLASGFSPNVGNNNAPGVTIPNWTPEVPGTNNLVRVDGTNYNGGPNTAHSGNYYYDGDLGSLTTAYIYQQFNLNVPVHYIDFGAYFSAREVVPAGGYPHDVSVSIWSAADWGKPGASAIATASLKFYATDADTPTKDAQWMRAFAEIPYLQAGDYYIRVDLHNATSVDSVFFYSYEAPEPGGAIVGLLLGAGLLRRKRRSVNPS